MIKMYIFRWDNSSCIKMIDSYVVSVCQVFFVTCMLIIAFASFASFF